jgi:hypothetical protein
MYRITGCSFDSLRLRVSMVRSIFLFAAAAGAILAFSPAARSAAETLPPLPSAILPDAWGVNIHFTDPRPGEMEMLAQGGFAWISTGPE